MLLENEQNILEKNEKKCQELYRGYAHSGMFLSALHLYIETLPLVSSTCYIIIYI